MSKPIAPDFASTGIEGLDTLLRGGFPRDDLHLLEGGAGTGKTTFGLQFLLAGLKAGEKGLYITLAQTRAALQRIALSHGWSLEGLSIYELSPADVMAQTEVQQTVLHTADVELNELMGGLQKTVDEVCPRRVVFDSIGVIGLLAGSASRFHREVVRLRDVLAAHGCTSLFIGDSGADRELEAGPGTEFHALAGSVMHVGQDVPTYGDVRRRLRIIKTRGVPVQGGYHDFRIQTGGAVVFPRLGLTLESSGTSYSLVPSGIATLDKLLGGGLERGTACLLLGSPGTGKSTLAALYARSAAQNGDRAAIFLFEERPETWKARARGVGIDLTDAVATGRVTIRQLDATGISAGEFSQDVRLAVERDHAKMVVLDSLTGYFNAMGEAEMLTVQMHSLLNYLSHHDVLTVLVVAQQGLMNIGPRSLVDISYLSDSIIVLSMFEADGTIRRCLTAIKKRQGEHDTTIRELIIRAGEITVGNEALHEYRGVLTGQPVRIHLVSDEDEPR
jgi:circadian clock protein KaiC